MTAPSKTAIDRRGLLHLFGAGTVGAAVVHYPTGAEADTETNDEKRKPRYRETDHIKTFYRVNRYPR